MLSAKDEQRAAKGNCAVAAALCWHQLPVLTAVQLRLAASWFPLPGGASRTASIPDQQPHIYKVAWLALQRLTPMHGKLSVTQDRCRMRLAMWRPVAIGGRQPLPGVVARWSMAHCCK